MKKLLIFLVATTMLIACKDDTKKEEPLVIQDLEEVSEIGTL